MFRYKEIKNLLAAEVAKLHSNDRLPSRPELCKKLDTTRTTIDRAVSELVKEGALYSRKGGGTYVADAGGELATQSGGCSWGVIVRDVRVDCYAEFVRGVENVAQSYGINTILCNSDSDFEKQEQYIKRLINFGVSGIIIIPIVSPDARENYRLFNQLTELKIPFVFCNRNAEGINASIVSTNDYYGGYMVTKHLLEKGYRNIAYISYRKFRTSLDRYQGYISALVENGVAINRKLIVIEEKDQGKPLGYESMQKILASAQKVDAVFCFNDIVAESVYQAIAEAGLKVSDDIGVIGYDNTDICEKSTPAITSVNLNNLTIGIKAAEVLYKQINQENSSDFEFYLYSPELVVRDSCLGLKRKT
jgi:DNA-binding LacI/PurR family transcriptional regulator